MTGLQNRRPVVGGEPNGWSHSPLHVDKLFLFYYLKLSSFLHSWSCSSINLKKFYECFYIYFIYSYLQLFLLIILIVLVHYNCVIIFVEFCLRICVIKLCSIHHYYWLKRHCGCVLKLLIDIKFVKLKTIRGSVNIMSCSNYVESHLFPCLSY